MITLAAPPGALTPARIDAIADHVLDALARARAGTVPFRHWLLDDVLPDGLCRAIAGLPMPPAAIVDTRGKRETHNTSRRFLAGALLDRDAACRDLAAALQDRTVTDRIAALGGTRLRGTSLRIEYCQDTDGFWLEPHTDIADKRLTLLVYLSDEPAGERWGTDLMTSGGAVVATAPCRRRAGMMFVPGPDTWHGFAKRAITGVRRSLIVNYVAPTWRARHELAFPDQPVA